MVNNNEEMVQQMKRPQYRPQQPGNHNNMIPLNMVPKPYIQNVSILIFIRRVTSHKLFNKLV